MNSNNTDFLLRSSTQDQSIVKGSTAIIGGLNTVTWDTLIHDIAIISVSASKKIMEIYNRDFDFSLKDDLSPLTEADLASNQIITSFFRKKHPYFSILSEEEDDCKERLTNPNGVLIVDPLDGTKEFINKNGEFCVSIGFAIGHKLKAGVIAVPAAESLYYAVEGLGAYKIRFSEIGNSFTIGLGIPLHVSHRRGKSNDDRLIIALSRSHTDSSTVNLIEKNAARIESSVTAGSCLKGCMIAEGIADIHYRFSGATKEWDTAAMQIICEEAGAVFTDLFGNTLPANRVDPYNREGFIILNSAESALDITDIQRQ